MRSPFADVVRHVVTFATLVLLAVRIGGAQTIRGRVVAKADGAPVSSAIVSLIDTTGSAVATKLADDSGSFSFVAPLAGRYAVRAERVGFLSANSSFRLFGQGEAPDVLITMTSEAVSLRAIVVNADRRCLVRPQEGVATAQLWSEARKALSAIQLTALAQATAKARRDPHRFLVRWRSVTRDLDPNGLAVLHSDEIIQMSETVLPFASADLDVLTRDGYMIGNPDSGSTFFAPDADILLSDRFLDSHCFRLEAPEADRRDNLIGLAFEPVGLTADRRSLHVDVRGVLWLDRASAELRYMEYHYVNLPPEETTRHAGGLLEFRPLPDGRWVVWRWYIRVPVLTRRRVELNSALSDWHTEIAKIHEDGAELLEVMPAGTHRTTVGSLRGTVVDSLSGAAMAGIRVFLSGTSFAAVTGSDGTYRIDSIPPGRYSVSIIAPRLDSL
ncbi:MAG TPA: carboxypeptidase-like regulatory domain-containing protein, partial [Gemmatimonadaceae bacterium]